MLVECLDDGADRDRRIVAVQQVEVDIVRAQARQRVGQIRSYVVRGDAIAVLVEMGALAEDDDFSAVAPFLHPQPECAIDFAAAIAVGRVVGRDAGL